MEKEILYNFWRDYIGAIDDVQRDATIERAIDEIIAAKNQAVSEFSGQLMAHKSTDANWKNDIANFSAMYFQKQTTNSNKRTAPNS